MEATQSGVVRSILEAMTVSMLRELWRFRRAESPGGRTKQELATGLARSFRGDLVAVIDALDEALTRDQLGKLLDGYARRCLPDFAWVSCVSAATKQELLEGIRAFAVDAVSLTPGPLVGGKIKLKIAEGVADGEQAVDEEESGVESELERLPSYEFLPGSAAAELHDFVLADFQEEAQAALDAAFLGHGNAGRTAGILCMPTGAGKTRTTVDWVLKRFVRNGQRVLWVAHRLELLDQAHLCFRHCAKLAERPFSVSRVDGTGKRFDGDVVIASIQSLVGVPLSQFRRSNRDGVSFVVWDEAHRAGAQTWSTVLRKFKTKTSSRVLGLTATPFRSSDEESARLLKLFGAQRDAQEALIYQTTFADLIRRRFLALPDFTRYSVQTQIELDSKCRDDLRTKRVFTQRVLSAFARSAERTREIVRHWVQKQESYGQTVAFACNIDHAEFMARCFREAGVAAWAVHSKLDRAERLRILDAYRRLEGRPGVLVNVGLLTEGWDVPSTRTVLMARPTESKVLYEQMIGRAARGPRVWPGKERFFVVDCVDNVDLHGVELAGSKVEIELQSEVGKASDAVPACFGAPGGGVGDRLTDETGESLTSGWIDEGRFDDFEFEVFQQRFWGVLSWKTEEGGVRAIPVFEESHSELADALEALGDVLEGRGSEAALAGIVLELVANKALRFEDWDQLEAGWRLTGERPQLIRHDATWTLDPREQTKLELYALAQRIFARLREQGRGGYEALVGAVREAIACLREACEKTGLTSDDAQDYLAKRLDSEVYEQGRQKQLEERRRKRDEEALVDDAELLVARLAVSLAKEGCPDEQSARRLADHWFQNQFGRPLSAGLELRNGNGVASCIEGLTCTPLPVRKAAKVVLQKVIEACAVLTQRQEQTLLRAASAWFADDTDVRAWLQDLKRRREVAKQRLSPNEAFCSACNALFEGNLNYCGHCGMRLQRAQPT